MKLYGALASPYVARVVMAARLKGLALDVVLPPGGLKSPEFLRLNPLGKIPALEDEGRCVVESAVILEYLEDLHPAPPLLPADAWGRAQVRALARAVDLYFAPHSSVLLRPQGDPAVVAAAIAGLRQGLASLEGLMGEGPWARGAAPTLADCTLLPTLQLAIARNAPAHGLGDLLAPHPKLAAWWAHVSAEPGCAALLAEIEVALREFLARMAAQRAAG